MTLTDLSLPRTVRKRRSYEERTAMNTKAAAIARGALRSIVGRQFITDPKTGRRERVFTAQDWCGPEDVRAWLLNRRVVELDDALEFVSRAVLRFLIDGGYLRKDAAGFWWITRKAAEKYDLPRVMGREFPS